MSVSKPLVSWLMPVYNAERYIFRSLDSILSQTYQNFEVIIINDGCEDSTREICRKYAAEDKRVIIYDNDKNIGVAKSLNRGLELCSGKYIARMDADDYSYPQRLDKQVSYMENNPDVDILGTWCRFITDNKAYIFKHHLDSERLRTENLFRPSFTHSTVVFRSEPFKINHWRYPICEAEDHALFAMLISKSRMACIPDVLLDHYLHSDSICGSNPATVQLAGVNVSRKALFEELNIDTSVFSDYVFLRWRHSGTRLPHNLKQHMIDVAKLLRQISLANELLNKFDGTILIDELQRQWEYTKNVVYLKDLPILLTFTESDTANIDKSIDHILSYPKVIIYCTGYYCSSALDKINRFANVIAFCDSDPGKHGTDFAGKKTISPKQLGEYTYNYIFIASAVYENEIRKNLISNCGINPEIIFNLADLMVHYNNM